MRRLLILSIQFVNKKQSFPIESKSHPELTEKGAYVYPYTVYTQSDVQFIIKYAKYRGIRVVPEFDGNSNFEFEKLIF